MSLLGRLGPQLARALESYMIRCDDHGMQPVVVLCQCILDGEPIARTTAETLLCGEHARLLEERDLGEDDGVKPFCRACASGRGLA